MTSKKPMQRKMNRGNQHTSRFKALGMQIQLSLQSPKVIGSLALAAGPVLYFARNAMQVLVVLLVIALFIPSWSELRDSLIRRACENWIIFLFVAVGLLSVFWSLDTAQSLERALRLGWEFFIGLALIVGFSSLEESRRRLVIEFCASGFSFTAIFITFYLGVYRLLGDDHISPMALHDMARGFSRGTAIHAILAIPLGFALWTLNKRSASALVVVSAITAAIVVLKLSPSLAIAAGFLTFCIVFLLPHSRYIFYTVFMSLLVFAPLVLPLPVQNKIVCELAEIKFSAAHRIIIWNFTDQKIAERPLLGWGLDTSRLVPGHDTPVNISKICADQNATTNRKFTSPLSMPLHPHNAPLQIWLEMGALGIVASALLMWTIIARMQAAYQERLQRAILTATFAATYVVLCVSFSLFQGWFMASLFFVAAVLPLCLKKPVA